MKTLVTYFSASGVTKAVAERMAAAIEADLFPIEPSVCYSDADPRLPERLLQGK